MKLNKVVSGMLATMLVFSLASCSDSDKQKENTSSSSVSFNQTKTEPYEEKITAEIVSNSFEGIGNTSIYGDCSNEFFTVIYAQNTLGVADGIYSSPKVSVQINGKSVSAKSLGYAIVSGGNINISVSFSGCFVEKGSEIFVTLENFNALREAENEDDFVGYDEYTDQVVFEGRLEIKATTNVDFGNFWFDFSDENAGELTVGNSSASFENALGKLGEKPSVDQIVLVTKAGTEVKFDKVYDLHYNDDEGNILEDYTAIFSFDDDRVIDLSEIDDIKLCGESLFG